MAHDGGLVRTLGRHGAGLFHGPDLLVAATGQLLPMGTFAFRAGAFGSLLAGIFGLLTFELAKAALSSAGPLPAPFPVFLQARITAPAIFALVASFLVSLAPVVQFEATTGGSAILGGVLTFAPTALLVSRASASLRPRAEAFYYAVLVGLGFAQEPLIFASTVAVSLAIEAVSTYRLLRAHPKTVFLGAALGVSPMGFAIADSLRDGLRVAWFAVAQGDAGAVRSLFAFLRSELGYLELALGTLGFMVLAVSRGANRALAWALLAIALCAVASVKCGAATGPERFGTAALALAAVSAVCAAVAVSEILTRVAQAPIPLARASAFMILVVFLVAPLKILDDTQNRFAQRSEDAAYLWEEWAFDELGAETLMLIADPRMFERVRAAQAAHTIRADIDVLPIFALDAPSAQSVIAKEPRLKALLRDMILAQSPSELALSELAAARPIIVEFGPTWDQKLSRHLLPAGLFLRYEPEPRGQSERRTAMDHQLPLRDRLATAVQRSKDADITLLTVRALRIRALAMALTGERESTSRALDDLRLFAPKDPFSEELVRRIVLSKGQIDVTGLNPSL
jgi:hypothetical protein